MSNARNLANLLGTNTTIQTAKLADSSISTAKLADSSISTAKLADDAITSAKLPAGCILQVQNVHFTQRHQINNNTNRTGLSGQYAVSITPKFSSSKILVQTNINCIANNTQTVRAILVRQPSGGSKVDIAQMGWYQNAANWDPLNTNFGFLDSPATTTTLAYFVEWRLQQGNLYINYANTSAGFGGSDESRSTITVMEIAV